MDRDTYVVLRLQNEALQAFYENFSTNPAFFQKPSGGPDNKIRKQRRLGKSHH